MKRLSFITLSTLLSLFTVACNQNKQSNGQNYAIPSDKSTTTPVFTANFNAQDIPKNVLNNLQTVFSQALPVRSTAWEQTSTGNIKAQGYLMETNITFQDYYGISFAYVHNRSVGLGPTPSTEADLAALHDPTATPPTDGSNWNNATYVTGANTRRTPISVSFYGFPILYGIYSADSAAKGFDYKKIKRYVAFSDSLYWVETTDGKWFDLMGRKFISNDELKVAKQAYDDVLAAAAADTAFPTYADDMWSKASTVIGTPLVDTTPCKSGSTSALCTTLSSSSLIKPQSLTWGGTACRSYRFLWWSWSVCDSNIWFGNMPETKYSKTEYQDKDISGIAEGCGPASGAAMLWWWKKYKSYNTVDNDYHSDYWTYGIDAAYKRAKTKLITDMRAFNTFYLLGFIPISLGDQRAVWPGEYADGLNRYLDARGVTNLRVKREYGWGPAIWGKVLDRLKTQFSKEEPVVALHASAALQHYAVLKEFHRDPFGDIWAMTQSDGRNLNLSAWWVFSGVYWVEQVP